MTVWQKSEPPCPPWCANHAEHLTDMLKRGWDYWHRGKVTEIPTTETTPNGDVIQARAYLAQRAHMDERGWMLHPAEVVVESPGGLLPAEARQLAELVAELASMTS